MLEGGDAAAYERTDGPARGVPSPRGRWVAGGKRWPRTWCCCSGPSARTSCGPGSGRRVLRMLPGRPAVRRYRHRRMAPIAARPRRPCDRRPPVPPTVRGPAGAGPASPPMFRPPRSRRRPPSHAQARRDLDGNRDGVDGNGTSVIHGSTGTIAYEADDVSAPLQGVDQPQRGPCLTSRCAASATTEPLGRPGLTGTIATGAGGAGLGTFELRPR
jgi:hypothetical protein